MFFQEDSRIKSYRLTPSGRRHLAQEKATWQRVVTAHEPRDES